jgi:hypothetical protein
VLVTDCIARESPVSMWPESTSGQLIMHKIVQYAWSEKIIDQMRMNCYAVQWLAESAGRAS